MVTLTSTGDFSKLTGFFNRCLEIANLGILDKYGRLGVEALAAATPVDSGRTAQSWEYKITHTDTGVNLEFWNYNINDGVPIALILQYGHGTGTGGWVEGRDYINPALRPVFDSILNDVWKEISK
jgi:hypothetical protein